MYGLTGYCSGPLLGGTVTLTATTPARLVGALLLATYAVGMTAPLLILAGAACCSAPRTMTSA